MSDELTVAKTIAQFRSRLAEAGVEDALRDARLILSHIADLRPLDIITRPNDAISSEQFQRAMALIERRIKGESIHRMIGHREFYSLDLLISAETLEPRPDTEILVEALLAHLEQFASARAPKILDLGTGTGAICLSLLSACPSAIGVGVDISMDALQTSQKNADIHGLTERYQALQSNWFDAVEGCFDIIVSNPPYIRSEVIPTLDVIVRGFDPMAALDGGPDGLEPYRVIAAQGQAYLAADGVIGVEIGFDQKIDVITIFEDNGFSLLESRTDYGGNDRALLFKIAHKSC